MKFPGMKGWLLTVLLICIGWSYIVTAASDVSNGAEVEPSTPEAEQNNGTQAPVVEPSPEPESTGSPGGGAGSLLPASLLLIISIATLIQLLL
ncbi:hypothetical protein SNE40_004445 [Patella caerulea]|uniref:Uncharacterized protein n=1 Tax=Patella caerulea TaxID=87958 RepID=A0AAN8Q0Y7_PATCE